MKYALFFLAIGSLANFSATEDSHQIKRATSIACTVSALPRLVHETIQWTVQRGFMGQLYPAQNFFNKRSIQKFRADYLTEQREELQRTLTQEQFIVSPLTLEKDTVHYSALLIGHKDTIENGQWILQATGNKGPIERFAADFAKQYNKIGYNILLVNGPGVGQSEGFSTPKTMGDAQEIGLCYLEQTVRAKKIVLAGYSLGGASIGMAILSHRFDQEHTDYLVIRQMTFDRTTSIFKDYARMVFPPFEPVIKHLVLWANCEIDSVAASKKLTELNIPEVIIQAGTTNTFASDGMIPVNSSLGYHLQEEGLLTNTKSFYTIPNATHIIPLPQTLTAISRWKSF